MATAKRTRDHQKIRDWAESRHGRPAVVEGTEALLRIDFEEPEPDAKLKPIDWDGFFRVLDDKQLTFLFDPAPEGRMHKFIFGDEKTRARKAGKRSAARPGAKGAAKSGAKERGQAGRQGSRQVRGQNRAQAGRQGRPGRQEHLRPQGGRQDRPGPPRQEARRPADGQKIPGQALSR
jgi:hypothetical protein